MRILISNDDGVFAPGIRALANELQKIAQIKVIAPDRNCSSSSHSLTLRRPLFVSRLEDGYYCVDGTPTDCVHTALCGYFDEPFDLVVAGINSDFNLGDDVMYSGTVAAAIEGRDLGLPALAFSLQGPEPKHYETAAVVAKRIVLNLGAQVFPSRTIFNVNVPDLPIDAIKGIKITRLGRYHRSEAIIKSQDPRGRSCYWIGPQGPAADDGVGTDFHAVKEGYVSITPINIDMTDYSLMEHAAIFATEGSLV